MANEGEDLARTLIRAMRRFRQYLIETEGKTMLAWALVELSDVLEMWLENNVVSPTGPSVHAPVNATGGWVTSSGKEFRKPDPEDVVEDEADSGIVEVAESESGEDSSDSIDPVEESSLDTDPAS